MMNKKICMLGEHGVGKTSLVKRYVSSIFSETYQTTVGVKIDKKIVTANGKDISLILWDLHGETKFQKVSSSYLRGMAAFLLVIDVTRPQTLDTALNLKKLAEDTVGSVPFVCLLNKSDLENQLSDASLDPFKGSLLNTSAKTGAGVEAAFQYLADQFS